MKKLDVLVGMLVAIGSVFGVSNNLIVNASGELPSDCKVEEKPAEQAQVKVINQSAENSENKKSGAVLEKEDKSSNALAEKVEEVSPTVVNAENLNKNLENVPQGGAEVTSTETKSYEEEKDGKKTYGKSVVEKKTINRPGYKEYSSKVVTVSSGDKNWVEDNSKKLTEAGSKKSLPTLKVEDLFKDWWWLNF